MEFFCSKVSNIVSQKKSVTRRNAFSYREVIEFVFHLDATVLEIDGTGLGDRKIEILLLPLSALKEYIYIYVYEYKNGV